MGDFTGFYKSLGVGPGPWSREGTMLVDCNGDIVAGFKIGTDDKLIELIAALPVLFELTVRVGETLGLDQMKKLVEGVTGLSWEYFRGLCNGTE